MSQTVGQWLLLTDYASKHRVSVSTLRRRIKAGELTHKFEGGRYYLPDTEAVVRSHDRSSVQRFNGLNLAASPMPLREVPLRESSREPLKEKKVEQPETPPAVVPNEEPLITTTTRLLNEVKQAYTLILHEKEEQIVYLKKEISDLRTLIRALESENSRLRG